MKKHPAKYSKVLLPLLAEALQGYPKVIDPMAGVGGIFQIEKLVPGMEASACEIEKEWQEQNPRTVLGDALALPWPDGFFDACCVSPTYGNRMADHHNARDASKRNTYRHTLGRELSPQNSGNLQWGREYRAFHQKAWQEVWRVLRPGGRFVLNISDHIRKGKVVPVCRFHKLLLYLIGFDLVRECQVATPRQRQGENGQARVAAEMIFVFEKPDREF